MYRKGKIILPVLIVLIIISLSFGGASFYLYQKEHAKNIQLQEQISQLGDRQRATEKRLEDAKKTASELTLKLQEASSKVEALTKDLAQGKSALTEASNKLEQFKADLAQQKTLRQDLENKLTEVQDEGKQIKEQLKIVQQQKTELEAKFKNMEAGSDGVELGKVVVNGGVPIVDNTAKGKSKAKAAKQKIAAVALKPADQDVKTTTPVIVPESKIMIVNKEFNFVVINLGSKDGVSVGDEFSITREGKYIGDLKVEKVHDSMSAAGFSPELKDLIKENDKIAPKAK
ncbi:MAG: hypothetical protein COV71_02360 [Candidatus Omnitrophica bacterium CG11_big_fil_rev_8_21_14_0_20_41_12]|nr:MAG: hypothetical protein COV71_02360 [Candidatus Omnitrophica bacterium CG11_big_fil_rev_8_21_14_0_20_41_12]